MAQVVYYVTATDHFRGDVNFCVPSGNFGNVFSGWIAKRMGAPIDRLVVASNANDILTRFFNDNDMSTRPVVPSLSPSMDIQVSSNFERLLFEINGRDGGLPPSSSSSSEPVDALSIEADQRADAINGVFTAARLDDDETIEVIRARTRVDRHAGRSAHRRRSRCRRHGCCRRPPARSSRWRQRIRRSSPTRSSAPPDVRHNCQLTWRI